MSRKCYSTYVQYWWAWFISTVPANMYMNKNSINTLPHSLSFIRMYYIFSILELRVFKLRAQIRITRTPGGGGGGSGGGSGTGGGSDTARRQSITATRTSKKVAVAAAEAEAEAVAVTLSATISSCMHTVYKQNCHKNGT